MYKLILSLKKYQKLKQIDTGITSKEFKLYLECIFDVILKCVQFEYLNIKSLNNKSKELNPDKSSFKCTSSNEQLSQIINQYYTDMQGLDLEDVLDYFKEKTTKEGLIFNKVENKELDKELEFNKVENKELDKDSFLKLMNELIDSNEGRLGWVRLVPQLAEGEKNNDFKLGFNYLGIKLERKLFEEGNFIYVIKELAGELPLNEEIKYETINDIIKTKYSKDIKEAIEFMFEWIYSLYGEEFIEEGDFSVLNGAHGFVFELGVQDIIKKEESNQDETAKTVLETCIKIKVELPNDFLIFLSDDNIENYYKYTNFNCIEVLLVFFMIINPEFKIAFRELYKYYLLNIQDYINNKKFNSLQHRTNKKSLLKTYSPDSLMRIIEFKCKVKNTKNLDSIPIGSVIREEEGLHYVYKFGEDRYVSLWNIENYKLEILTKEQVDFKFKNILTFFIREKYYYYDALEMMNLVITNILKFKNDILDKLNE
ncbi:MAG: hypothetical protein N4A49_02420 [Marinifilaceae bacterium]|nr:hypothetical protein [Marinifilaceae bacterium]